MGLFKQKEIEKLEAELRIKYSEVDKLKDSAKEQQMELQKLKATLKQLEKEHSLLHQENNLHQKEIKRLGEEKEAFFKEISGKLGSCISLFKNSRIDVEQVVGDTKETIEEISRDLGNQMEVFTKDLNLMIEDDYLNPLVGVTRQFKEIISAFCKATKLTPNQEGGNRGVLYTHRCIQCSYEWTGKPSPQKCPSCKARKYMNRPKGVERGKGG